jgi:phosphatidate cytidylyltransferase
MNSVSAPSDLKVRVLSAIVMVTVAGVALWLGGWTFTIFVGVVALGLLWEFVRLVTRMTGNLPLRIIGYSIGMAYIGATALGLLHLRVIGIELALFALLVVIATDVGAYFAGRAIGGPKIAPSISPSKTWAGLFGGMAAAVLATWLFRFALEQLSVDSALDKYLFAAGPMVALIGPALLAVFAQAGDFMESAMKRKAGVKDSSRLIPGHGGLFDRLDGLLPVVIVLNLVIISGVGRS